MTLHPLRRGGRGAYTLMELLIVVIIMMTLVAIALPIAKKTMEDSGPREATRQLSAFFELAKAKAASTGRPWGIWIECVPPVGPGDPAILARSTALRQATKFYLAESPELYAGDFLDARAYVDMTSPLTGTTGPWPLKWKQASDQTNLPTVDSIAVSTLYTLLTGLSPLAPSPPSKTEFFIRFNYAGPWFRGYVGPNLPAVTGANANYAFYIYGKTGRDQVLQSGQLFGSPTPAWGIAGLDDDNTNGPDDIGAGEYLAASSDDVRPPFPVTGANGVPFQIVREPQRVNNTVELSSGTCIDLTYSGLGPSGVDFSGYYPGFDFIPPNKPLSYYSTIVLMFLPGGGIDSLYLVQTPGSAGGPNTIYGQFNATGNIHFLIGKVQKVNVPAPPQGQPGPGSNPTYFANMFDPEASNLMDSASFWLTIGRFNGSITTSENTPPSLVTNASPNLTYQIVDPLGNPAQLTYRADLFDDPASKLDRIGIIEYCRTIAISQQQMGGR